MRGRAWHFIPPNEAVRVPTRHVMLDSESRRTPIAGGERQEWRNAALCLANRTDRGNWIEHWDAPESPEALWKEIDAFTREDARTIVWAHNLGYDLRITHALPELLKLGWEYEFGNNAPRALWMRWRKNGATLILADTMAIWPTKLDNIAKALGVGRPQLPAEAASEAAWHERARADTEVLTGALKWYLEWLRREEMGNWQVTGAGQSWAAWRHRWLDHRVCVHDDEEAIKAERKAMWTGRCEAWQHGTGSGRKIIEYDFALAYARIAQREDVPVKLKGMIEAPSLDRLVALLGRNRILLECEVTTDVAILPTTIQGRMAWPVGTFTTTVWDPEWTAAMRAGVSITPLRAWVYLAKPALRSWADWIISRLEGPESDASAMERLVVKHWARALIGRLGLRYQKWEDFATSDESTISRSRGTDLDTGTDFELQQIGTKIQMATEIVESPNSVPMVPGYVMSCARAQLWKWMSRLEPEDLLYVDTDSLVVTRKGQRVLESFREELVADRLVIKGIYNSWWIAGPRQVRFGPDLRIAGVPKGAQRAADGTMTGEVWDTYPEAMRARSVRSVVVRNRTWQLRGVDRRRTHLPRGRTAPIEVGNRKAG
jgi:hypothetical protein